MKTLPNPDITITPALQVEHVQKASATPSISLPKHIVHAFREVPKEIQPRWSDSDPIHASTREEVAKVPPLSKLPNALLPQDAMALPPYLHYGLPMTLEQITSFVQSRDPNVQIFADHGQLSNKAEQLVADCFTEEIGLPVYLERVLNAPDTLFILCLLDNYIVKALYQREEMPKKEHIRRMQKALGVDPQHTTSGSTVDQFSDDLPFPFLHYNVITAWPTTCVPGEAMLDGVVGGSRPRVPSFREVKGMRTLEQSLSRVIEKDVVTEVVSIANPNSVVNTTASGIVPEPHTALNSDLLVADDCLVLKTRRSVPTFSKIAQDKKAYHSGLLEEIHDKSILIKPLKFQHHYTPAPLVEDSVERHLLLNILYRSISDAPSIKDEDGKAPPNFAKWWHMSNLGDQSLSTLATSSLSSSGAITWISVISMAILFIPEIITPALSVEDSVPKELHPRWSDANPIITEEELAMVLPMSKLPCILLPRNEIPSPPCLQYGLPITLKQIFSLRNPNTQVINKSGSSSCQAGRLFVDRLTAEIGLTVYLQRVVNGPGTPFVVCRLQKALGVNPKILSMCLQAFLHNTAFTFKLQALSPILMSLLYPVFLCGLASQSALDNMAVASQPQCTQCHLGHSLLGVKAFILTNSMSTSTVLDITITPAHPVEDSQTASTTQSSLPEPIVQAFRKVPKEIHPRWSDSDPFYTREEVAKVPPMSKLPRALLPLHKYASPPYLHYGFLLTFDQITSFVHSRDPSIPITTDLGLLSIKTDDFVEKCLTEIVGLPIYLERALNAPDTSYIIACLVDNYSIQSSMRHNKIPKEKHIRQVQKAFGIDSKVLPMWYIAGGAYQWRAPDHVDAYRIRLLIQQTRAQALKVRSTLSDLMGSFS
ncbi:hypothetical protein HETIRDRAFT_423795 [Heterobasidion irregulare TC 32-1]|uniref:Uncharacterized protein n=1 Tax=Heterobasidion irregulare (strain TC 32-1) TaxID=747525 RepID=W4KNQ8_HETIT|nr:uncharacterized protein HETIRDRAFT_423795 [Heterobasidion irregulare TC 32-1]ETW86686.1 hypothetical protein HETIRDRAFT_423795 [Heterobasidion irregulare TC 32-1]